MDLLLHFKVNEGDENNINIQEYMLYGDVETKSEKCLVDEGDEVVLTEFPVPEFKNCTLMKKGDEGFYEYKDYRHGENAELAGGYAISGILQQNKRFDFNYVNDQINGIVQDPFYKVEIMGDYTFYDVKGNEYHDLKDAWDAIQECTKGYKLSDYKENKFVGRFMKADVLIGLGLAGEGIVIKLKTPLRTINVDSVNPVGRVNFNRKYKRINDIRYSLNKTIETIQNYEGNLKIAKEMVNKPFELQDELTSARKRQKEINKILDTSGNENSKVVVEDDLEEERNESCMEL